MLSNRRREAAIDELRRFYARIKRESETPAQREGVFVHRCARDIGMMYHVYAALLPILEGREEIGDVGQFERVAPNDQAARAPSPTLSGESGQKKPVASSDHVAGAASPDRTRSVGGQGIVAAPNGHGDPAAPLRSPPRVIQPTGPSPGRIAAALESKMKSAVTAIFFLHDGRNIMTCRMRELPEYRKVAAKQAAVIDRILKRAANPDWNAKVSDFITETLLTEIVADVDKELRHVA